MNTSVIINREVKPDDPRLPQAFPRLSPLEIAALEPYGKRKQISKGEELWRAGQVDLCMYVIVDGELQIVEGRTGIPIIVHTPGSFSGDVDILTGRASVVTAIAHTDCKLLEIAPDCVRSIVAEHPTIGETILRAFLMRRALLIEQQAGILIVGSRFCPDTLRIREFLTRNEVPLTWEDLEARPETEQMLAEFNIVEDDTPVVVLPNGKLLKRPTNAELGEAVGIKRAVDSKVYDLVVIGAGPAGLGAAVYGASEGLETLVVDSMGPGGQAGTSSKIENYLGFPFGITGQELADSAVLQAEKFGANMVVPAHVKGIHCNSKGGHRLELEDDTSIECRCVILAMGARYRKLEIDNMPVYEGRGIFYAATHVERVLCGPNQVAVVGGGNSAGQAAVFMAQQSKHVFLVLRAGDLRANMSSYLARRIERSDKITVLLNSEIAELQGDEYLSAITVRDRTSGKCRQEQCVGLFVMIGADPNTAWLSGQIELDPKGFILTGQQLLQEGKWSASRPPYFLETSCPGIFAAGDARALSVKRVASAVGEGAMAVAFVHQYLSS